MAQIPTKTEVENIKIINQRAIELKTESQAIEGKGFNVPADGHGPGVVPEDVWQNLPGKLEAKQNG